MTKQKQTKNRMTQNQCNYISAWLAQRQSEFRNYNYEEILDQVNDHLLRKNKDYSVPDVKKIMEIIKSTELNIGFVDEMSNVELTKRYFQLQDTLHEFEQRMTDAGV